MVLYDQVNLFYECIRKIFDKSNQNIVDWIIEFVFYTVHQILGPCKQRWFLQPVSYQNTLKFVAFSSLLSFLEEIDGSSRKSKSKKYFANSKWWIQYCGLNVKNSKIFY